MIPALRSQRQAGFCELGVARDITQRSPVSKGQKIRNKLATKNLVISALIRLHLIKEAYAHVKSELLRRCNYSGSRLK